MASAKALVIGTIKSMQSSSPSVHTFSWRPLLILWVHSGSFGSFIEEIFITSYPWTLCRWLSLLLWRPCRWSSLLSSFKWTMQSGFHGSGWMVLGYSFRMAYHTHLRFGSSQSIRFCCQPGRKFLSRFQECYSHCHILPFWCTHWLHCPLHRWQRFTCSTLAYSRIPKSHW